MPRIHGIFILVSFEIKELHGILMTLFFDESPAIKRILVHGVVCACQESEVVHLLASNYSETMVAVDKIVIFTNGQLAPSTSDALRALKDDSGQKLSYDSLPSKDSEYLDIYSFSRMYATQVFPNDNEYRRLRRKRGRKNSEGYVAHRFQFAKSLDHAQFVRWLEHFMLEHRGGKNLTLRIKGQLAFKGSREKHILQAVGGSWGIDTAGLWSNQSRRSTLLIVGKDLKYHAIEKELRQCFARIGIFEAMFYFIDSHCIVSVLVVMLVFPLSMTAVVALQDFGYVKDFGF